MVEQRAVMRVQTWIPEQESGDFLAAAGRQGWPTKVGGVADGDTRKLCVGPADWLVIGPTLDAASLRESVASELPTEGCAIVDFTDALAVVRLQGEHARSILSSGCGLDLHPAALGLGQCARTRLANVPVVIDCHAVNEFQLYVARSYGSYLQSWLADAPGTY